MILAWLKTANSQLLEFHHPFRVLKNVDHTDPCHNSKPLGTWNSWTSFGSNMAMTKSPEMDISWHFNGQLIYSSIIHRGLSHSKNPIFCGDELIWQSVTIPWSHVTLLQLWNFCLLTAELLGASSDGKGSVPWPPLMAVSSFVAWTFASFDPTIYIYYIYIIYIHYIYYIYIITTHQTCRLRFSWSSTRLEPLWALVEECWKLNVERQLISPGRADISGSELRKR